MGALLGVTNTIIYAEDWAIALQDRLQQQVKWKDICKVDYTNGRVLNNPYLTDPTVQTGLRGTPYTPQSIVETNESITINTFKILPQVIDRADLAQSTYMRQMEMADRQGVLLNEAIESALYASHASWTDFGAGDVAGTSTADTTTITVSITNIDDIILTIIKTIEVANGQSLLARNGGFVVWRPADFLLLKSFMMSNGFASADMALRNGVTEGIDYMGLTHYTSNLLTVNHVFAGVKKAPYIGICKDTYGQVMVNEKDPGLISGIAVVSRVDYAVKAWNNVKPIIFDVNVA